MHGERAGRWCFVGAVFLGATLVFTAEPLIGKSVLPLLGGTPSVWNTCLLFFQLALLAGYWYAHWAPSRLGLRRHALVHLVLLAVAFLLLPFDVQSASPPASGNPTFWLLGRLVRSVGVPFMLVAATAPLAQRWFASANLGNPYPLYAASNLGSFGALLAYPLLLEPALGVPAQGRLWALGFVALGGLLAICALVLPAPAAAPAKASVEPTRPPSLGVRLHWLVLAAVPSSLLLGVTTYLTTDIAAVPLLWVLPLAVYLLTFVNAFAERPWIPLDWIARWQPLFLIVLVLFHLWLRGAPPIVALPLHIGLFATVALGCHGALVRARPSTGYLTSFYLWLAAGGALGGALNTLVAPLLFDSIAEYPLMLVAAAALIPRRADHALQPDAHPSAIGILLLLAVTAAVGVAAGELQAPGGPVREHWAAVAGLAVLLTTLAALLLLQASRRPVLLAAGIAVMLGAGAVTLRSRVERLIQARNFFGVYQVRIDPESGAHVLVHGTTVHGAQLPGARRHEPLTYYHRGGPLGDVFGDSTRKVPLRVGVVGLGTGAAAAYARAGDSWTYYEIDPLVERIARESNWFTYLADSPAPVRVVLGDARLALAGDSFAHYDVLVIDAFSSDAIPVHLLAEEAIRLYLARLAPGGIIALHLSNRYFDLVPVVAALARESRAVARTRLATVDEDQARGGAFTSQWAVLARDEKDLGSLARDPRWQAVRAAASSRAWTDDYSNLVGALRWMGR